jgi:hypothetical protein
MGRWAQRSRRGGGPPPATAAAPITLVSITINDLFAGLLDWTFSADVDLADFTAGDFNDATLGVNGEDYTQFDTNVIQVHAVGWESAVAAGDVCQLQGTTNPNIAIPQTVLIS